MIARHKKDKGGTSRDYHRCAQRGYNDSFSDSTHRPPVVQSGAIIPPIILTGTPARRKVSRAFVFGAIIFYRITRD